MQHAILPSPVYIIQTPMTKYCDNNYTSFHKPGFELLVFCPKTLFYVSVRNSLIFVSSDRSSYSSDDGLLLYIRSSSSSNFFRFSVPPVIFHLRNLKLVSFSNLPISRILLQTTSLLFSFSDSGSSSSCWGSPMKHLLMCSSLH